MAASDDPKQVSPKVTAAISGGSWVLIGLTVVAFILSGITPDLLEFLGPWAGLISGALVIAGAAIRGYIVPDPLRQNYHAQVEAVRQMMDAETSTNTPGRHEWVPDENQAG